LGYSTQKSRNQAKFQFYDRKISKTKEQSSRGGDYDSLDHFGWPRTILGDLGPGGKGPMWKAWAIAKENMKIRRNSNFMAIKHK